MAITKDGKTTYVGKVLYEREKYWLDGMLEVWAGVWDDEEQKVKTITVGYYGSDCCNLAGCAWEIDATDDTKRAVLRKLKEEAWGFYCKAVTEKKNAIKKGVTAEVIRGKKVPKGTILKIFWVGKRETYRSRLYTWMNEYEEIAGGIDQDGNKVYVKTEYLKNIDLIKSPCAAERRKFLKAWVKNEAKAYGIYMKY